VSSAAYGGLPFQEQIDFFRQKVGVPTDAWTDVYAAEHDHAFMVAGARGDLLTDLRGSIDGFIARGETLADFRKQFDDLVAKHGWAYNGGRNWRTRIIYETNLRQSYHAGREAQMADPALRRGRPYGLYRHGGSAEPRPEHLAWDGTVLPLDDPWWDTHSPQNGWGCKCKKFTLSERDVQRLGLQVAEQAPPIEWEEKQVGTRGPSPRTVRVPKGIDPGFEYAPGRSRIEALTPPPLPGGDLLPPVGPARAGTLPPLAPRQASPGRLLPDNLPDQAYADRFLGEFLAPGERHAFYEDVTGELLLISDALLRERSGQLKVNKRGRGKYLLLYADTIKRPQEIWQDWAEFGDRTVLRRRYVAYWQVAGQDVPALTVFETGPHGWVGVTAHSAEDAAALDRRARHGARVWSEKE
jgi:hypothetical protein